MAQHIFKNMYFLLALCCFWGTLIVATPPHIIVILADDLGWHSIGYHNDEVQTPFIDKLATTQSLILSRHYDDNGLTEITIIYGEHADTQRNSELFVFYKINTNSNTLAFNKMIR